MFQEQFYNPLLNVQNGCIYILFYFNNKKTKVKLLFIDREKKDVYLIVQGVKFMND